MDCLVTKLKGAVDDSSLIRIGELRIKFNKVQTPTQKTQGFTFKFNKNAKLEIIGDGYFTDSDLSANKGKTLEIPAGTTTNVYVSNGDFDIAVLDKYSLEVINFYAQGISGVSLDDMKNRLIDFGDLKYSINMINISVSSSQASGDISAFQNLTNLTLLNINFTQVSGDISALENLTALTILELNSCVSVSGDISALENLTALTKLTLSKSQVSGDISALENLTALTKLSLDSTQVSGDISALENLTQLEEVRIDNAHGNLSNLIGATKLKLLSMKKGTITGDLAKLADACYFASFQNDNGSSLTWTTRPSTANIMAIEGNPKIDNVDKMLQDQAQCVKAIPSSGEIWYSVITATGTRTSASDDAVSTLQEKGYTVSIKNE